MINKQKTLTSHHAANPLLSFTLFTFPESRSSHNYVVFLKSQVIVVTATKYAGCIVYSSKVEESSVVVRIRRRDEARQSILKAHLRGYSVNQSHDQQCHEIGWWCLPRLVQHLFLVLKLRKSCVSVRLVLIFRWNSSSPFSRIAQTSHN